MPGMDFFPHVGHFSRTHSPMYRSSYVTCPSVNAISLSMVCLLGRLYFLSMSLIRVGHVPNSSPSVLQFHLFFFIQASRSMAVSSCLWVMLYILRHPRIFGQL